jgi:hypothetical protein
MLFRGDSLESWTSYFSLLLAYRELEAFIKLDLNFQLKR